MPAYTKPEPSSPLVSSQLQLFCGVDISARSFTAALAGPLAPASKHNNKSVHVPTYQQTTAGFAALRQALLSALNAATGQSSAPVPAQPGQMVVVMEATGTYWVRLATDLVEHGFKVSVLNPQQAHHFARAKLKRVKSDEVDAQTLLELAQVLPLTLWSPPPQLFYELQQRLAHRDNVLDLRTQLANQLGALQAGAVVVSAVSDKMQALLSTFDQQIDTLEKELEQVVQQEHEWTASIQLLKTIPGIAVLTACLLVVLTHNFEDFSSGAALSNYAGLAPLERSSGTSLRGRARLRAGGNARLRRGLYMAALSASRYNPAIKALYDRLRAAGKPMKVARCAAARKLLLQAYALVKTGQVFDATYQQKQEQSSKKLAKAC